MRFIIQRVKEAKVKVNNKTVGQINKGFLVFIGITHTDTIETADYMLNKMLKLRIFEDENEKMNLSLDDVNGEVLLISQFTLYADCKKTNRPSFIKAEKPERANKIYEYIVKECKKYIKTETGMFQEDMKVSLTNDGPVTIILDSDELKKIKEK